MRTAPDPISPSEAPPAEERWEIELDDHDVGLIRWMSGMTLAQHLEAAYNFMNDALMLRGGSGSQSMTGTGGESS